MTYDHLGLTRSPPSMKAVNTMNAIFPELRSLQDAYWEEAKERDLDLPELLHVNGWMLDKVLTNLYFLDNKTLVLILNTHAKAIKDPRHPFWSSRQKAVEDLHRRFGES